MSACGPAEGDRRSVARRRLAALVLGLLAFEAGTASAHHSIAAVYDSRRQLTVEGRVTEFQFVNPHPILVIEVAGDGGLKPWRLELDNRSELAAIGIAADTFVPGDRVIATGSAGRNEGERIYALKVERPADGLVYEQIGYSPRINRAVTR